VRLFTAAAPANADDTRSVISPAVYRVTEDGATVQPVRHRGGGGFSIGINTGSGWGGYYGHGGYYSPYYGGYGGYYGYPSYYYSYPRYGYYSYPGYYHYHYPSYGYYYW
jgi:hypothetical protein